ncbi:MAG: hypothetical protein ABI193_06925 [Minicystis sp.]
MQRRPGPTITDSSLGGSETPSMVGSAPGYARPSLAVGQASKVRTAGTSFVAIAAGGIALFLVLGGIAALVAYLVDPRALDFVIGTGKPPKASPAARVPAPPRSAAPVLSAKARPAR